MTPIKLSFIPIILLTANWLANNYPNMLTAPQLAHEIGVSLDKLRRLRRQGRIPLGKQLHKYGPIEWSEAEVNKIRQVVNG